MIVLTLLFTGLVRASHDFNVQFITNFVINERKPTFLVYAGLCWKKHDEIKLTKALNKLGVRTSSSLEVKSKFHENAVMFLTDLACDKFEEVIATATSRRLFQFSYRWLVLTNSTDALKMSLLEASSVLATSDLVLAEREDEMYTMTELHKPANNSTMVSTLRGYYNGTFLDVRPRRELYWRRRDLIRHPITMANVIQDSNSTKYYLPRDDRLELQNDAVAKVCWVFAKIAFDTLNATPQYIFSYRWGYKVNGKWSGMIHDIGENRADLGTNCVLFKDRLDMITYTDLVAPMRMRFVFRQPPLAYVTNIFALPFSSGVWLAIAVCSMVSAAALYLASIWEVKIEKSPTQLDGSIGDALLLTVSAVAQQGCFIEPRRSPGRIMEWVFFTALMALYAAYSANIVVLLQAPSNSIKNLAQLADSKVTLAANDVDYNRFVFNDNRDQLHISVHNTISPENGKPHFYDIFDGVERIRKGLFAFHSIVEPVYRRIEQTFLESEKCDLTEVDFINSLDAFTPVKKDSPYLELLRVVYKQIRESGLQAALNKRYQVPKPKCLNKIAAFSSVGLLDIQPVLILMLYGVALSVAIAVCEIIVFKM
ncbi:ionotropic receptor 75a-like [Manduca sexta]|uniref:ionotropic receptor 75a-like n=1 Tax=Manduca sexta TaxID=7130 RepID=UPI00188E8811|nr:ionotropic receptor 75a-like [Manduca sexta]